MGVLIENFKKLQYDVDRKIQYVANGMVRAQSIFKTSYSQPPDTTLH